MKIHFHKIFWWLMLISLVFSFESAKAAYITVPDTTWTVNGTNVFNANSGNVGIGTSSPNDLLTVVGDNPRITSKRSSSSGNSVSFLAASDSLSYPRAAFLIGDSSGDGIANAGLTIAPDVSASVQKPAFIEVKTNLINSVNEFRTILRQSTSLSELYTSSNAGNTAGTDLSIYTYGNAGQVYLKNNGNVGIGRTSPEVKLDFSTSSVAVIDVRTGYIRGLSSPPLGSDFAVSRAYVDDNFAPKLGGASLWATSTAGTYNVGLGNVGIGTTNPTAKLQVDGSSFFRTIDRIGPASNNPERGVWNPIWSSLAAGRALYADEEFEFSRNGVSVYNNSGGTAVSHFWENGDGSQPNRSGKWIRIVNNGGATNPGFGGFYQMFTCRPNATFVQRFRAKLPAGYALELAQNNIGDNHTSYWLTSTMGTGKWEEYIRVGHCGNTGSFSNGGHVYVKNDGQSGVFTWYLASSNVYEIDSPPGIFSGNVGIGTASPNSRLHVYNSAANAEIDIQSVVGAGNHWGLYNKIDDNSLRIWGGNDYVTVKRDGNVGIGTTNPLSKLQIGASDGTDAMDTPARLRILSATDQSQTPEVLLRLIRKHASGLYYPGSVDFKVYSWGTYGSPYYPRTAMTIALKGDVGSHNDSANVDVMTFLSSGNVGIGTTNPDAKLNIFGTVGSGSLSPQEDLLHIGGNELGGAGGYAGLKIGGTQVGTYSTYIRSIKTGAYGSVWNSDLAFSVTRAGTTNTIDEVMRLTSGGNVGIGTNNPFNKLEVDMLSQSSVTPLVVLKGRTSDETGNYGPMLGFQTERTQDNTIKAGIAFIRTAGYGSGDMHFLVDSIIDNNQVALSDSKMVISRLGSVGIGTTNPQKRLDLGGGTSGRIYGIDTSTSAIFTDSEVVPKKWIVDNFAPAVGGASLWATSTAGTYNVGLGNVGIGTTNPGARLEVNGSSLFSGYLQLKDYDGDAQTTSQIITRDNSLMFWTNGVVVGQYTNGLTPSINSGNLLVTGSTYLAAASGNVGIGTTNPRAKLEIGGGGSILAIGTYGSGWTEPNLGAGTRMMWYPRKAAFRAGHVDGVHWDNGNIGDYSTSFGLTNIASGIASFAIGFYTNASGEFSFASGEGTNAIGYGSFTTGSYSSAAGGVSVAMGSGSNASGDISVAMGGGTNASGMASVAMGEGGTASGAFSVAMGAYTTASGDSSVAIGEGGTASGSNSFSIGAQTTASGNYSTAMGNSTNANAYNSVAIGRYNVGGGTAGSWVATEPLFEVGIGASSVSKANALTILKNGNVGMGRTSPGVKLDFASSTNVVIDVREGHIKGLNSTPLADDYAVPLGHLKNNYVYWKLSGSNLYASSTSWKVGIGTTSPSEMLTVKGNAYIVGGLEVTNDSIIRGKLSVMDKLTVTTIDPLYQIKGVNYSTFAPSFVGGVKEEVSGRLYIKDKMGQEYQAVIDFNKQKVGSNLWVWYNIIDFNKENVEAIVTPYGSFANVYYYISGNQIFFRSDRPVEISYRLTGKRFDWQKWPTRAEDQTEKPGFIID